MSIEITKQVERDIQDWMINYLEQNNQFYDYKFPPCPFARAARLKGLVDVRAYGFGSVTEFINNYTKDLIEAQDFNTRILVFPPRTHWKLGLTRFIDGLNQITIPKDYYIQYGTAIQTKSCYPGWFNSGPYFIVIINKLSDVLEGHRALLNTDYYKPWSKQHYDEVVVRRQQAYEKYKK